MIVLSSDQAVKDLMDKRSSIYSDRPDMYIMQLIGDGNRFLSMVSLVIILYLVALVPSCPEHLRFADAHSITEIPGVCFAS